MSPHVSQKICWSAMPKCRSCGFRIGKSQKNCFRCGIWCPDKNQLMARFAIAVLVFLGLAGLLFLAAREQMTNAETRQNQQ